MLGLTPDAALQILRNRSIGSMRSREVGKGATWTMTYCPTRLNVETRGGLISHILGRF